MEKFFEKLFGNARAGFITLIATLLLIGICTANFQ